MMGENEPIGSLDRDGDDDWASRADRSPGEEIMDTENNISLILRAASFAADKHRNQRRKDAAASPYINHPIALAAILSDEAGVTDPAVLAAALLHDTVEDTETTIDEIEAEFGNNVAGIVAEVTDDKNLDKAERKRLQVEKAATKSAEAKLVKLADKISNLRDIADCPPADWSNQRRREYVKWAGEVVAGLRGVHPGLEAIFDRLAQKLRTDLADARQREIFAGAFDLQAEQAEDLAERAYKRTMAAKLRLMNSTELPPESTKPPMDELLESRAQRADSLRSEAVDALERADRADSDAERAAAREAFDGAIAALVDMGFDQEAEVQEAQKRAAMDYDKKVLRGVENKADYDEAIAHLSDRYRSAVEGTAWEETYARALAAAQEDAGPPDWLTLYEIEGRGVATVWPKNGMGKAWVWTCGAWREAPGLLTKPGYRLGRYQFKREFPAADGDALFALIKAFLGSEEFAALESPSLDPRLVRDLSIMDAGYEATVRSLLSGTQDFPTVLQEVQRDLGCEYSRIRPYAGRWYLHAVEEHGPFPNSTCQPAVDSMLTCLDTALAEWSPAGKSPAQSSDDDVITDYLWQVPKAICRFAEREFEGIAKKVRHTLQRAPATGIFGVSGHSHQWDEYCYHTHFGPPELDWAFDHLVSPLIEYRTGQLEPTVAVLLTIAQEWEIDDFEDPNSEIASPDLLRRGALDAVQRLALQRDVE